MRHEWYEKIHCSKSRILKNCKHLFRRKPALRQKKPVKLLTICINVKTIKCLCWDSCTSDSQIREIPPPPPPPKPGYGCVLTVDGNHIVNDLAILSPGTFRFTISYPLTDMHFPSMLTLNPNVPIADWLKLFPYTHSPSSGHMISTSFFDLSSGTPIKHLPQWLTTSYGDASIGGAWRRRLNRKLFQWFRWQNSGYTYRIPFNWGTLQLPTTCPWYPE